MSNFSSWWGKTNSYPINSQPSCRQRRCAATETERELMKLRGEMNRVRRELAEAQTQVKRQVSQQQVQQKAAEQAESSRELGIAKLNFTKGWLLAFLIMRSSMKGSCRRTSSPATSFATEP